MKAGLVYPYSWDMPPGIAWAVQLVPPRTRTGRSVLDATPVPDRSQPQIFGREGGSRRKPACEATYSL